MTAGVAREPDEDRNSGLTPEEERELAREALRDRTERAREHSEHWFELDVKAGIRRPEDRAWAVPYGALQIAGRHLAAQAFLRQWARRRRAAFRAHATRIVYRAPRRRRAPHRRRAAVTATRPSSTGDPDPEPDGRRHPRSRRRTGGAN